MGFQHKQNLAKGDYVQKTTTAIKSTMEVRIEAGSVAMADISTMQTQNWIISYNNQTEFTLYSTNIKDLLQETILFEQNIYIMGEVFSN